jgi:quinol monooxygenase YgiN
MAPMWRVFPALELYGLTALVAVIARNPATRHRISKFSFYHHVRGRTMRRAKMTQHALYVQLEAKPGKEQEVATFLSGARTMVNDEPDTTAWFAIRMGPRMFGIFDAFANERGRDAHLQGKLAKQITAKAPELFAKAPEIQRVEVLADKLPH